MKHYTNVWFDIDLDFAVHSLGDFGRTPWRRKDFQKEFLNITGHPYAKAYEYKTPAELLAEAMKVARLVTVATEPSFSTGFKGVVHILEMMNRCFSEYGDWFDWNDMQ